MFCSIYLLGILTARKRNAPSLIQLIMTDTKWVLFPVCENKTRNKIREETILKNYPLDCPKCKQESLIEAKNLHITSIKEPDA